jgi:tetratricopeptide (TPR) repeat protein
LKTKQKHNKEIGGIMLLTRVVICGVAANKKGDLDEAIRCYSKAISLKSDSAALFFVRGRAYWQKDQYDNAVSDLSRAIALNPRYAEAYNHRGVTYIGKGENQKALADFKKACELGYKDGCANVRKFK